MRKNSGLFKAATKYLPVFHGQYREMCSMAAVGQLGGPQMCELNEHIATCGSCRKFLESIAQASVQVLPVLAEDRIPAADIMLPVGMRARFLERLELEKETEIGGRLPVSKPVASGEWEVASGFKSGREKGHSEEEGCPSRAEKLVFQRLVPTQVKEVPRRSSRHSGLSHWHIAATAACAVIGVSAFYWGRKTPSNTPASVAISVPASAAPLGGVTAPNDAVATLEHEKDNLISQLTELRTKLTEAKADQDSLRKELVAANEKVASLQQTQALAAQESLKEVQDSKTQVVQLVSEENHLRQRLAESETKLAVQQQRTQEVSDKLQITEANLQEELSLKDAKSQMGELVAARNLHIVDVYDADPSGKRQRAFGRVFYTEGKSLVFYAYDLEDSRQLKANVVFHVWGGKTGVKEVTHNLGILHKDDEGESRWKMTFDDPNVLSQINSVFVTAEASNKKYDEPHGKKVLFAYFGSAPNHP
jgi:hypothetical protein